MIIPVETSGTLLVTGSNGRIGSMLKLLWSSKGCGLDTVWTGRTAPRDGVAWHIGNGMAPELSNGSVILHLAAVLQGEPAELAQNARDTATLCQVAMDAGARHVFVASTAAVYRPSPGDHAETEPADPANPYGAAKLAAEEAALRVLASRPRGPGLTILRIGNVAGADSLLGSKGVVRLDPVLGQTGGPLRSYIGPGTLARVLSALIARAARGHSLPQVLNIAEPGVVAMADLLTAAGRDWHFGPPRSGIVARAGLDTGRLAGLVSLVPATAAGVVADLETLKGRWP